MSITRSSYKQEYYNGGKFYLEDNSRMKRIIFNTNIFDKLGEFIGDCINKFKSKG